MKTIPIDSTKIVFPSLRRSIRWLPAVAIFAFVPKCVVCLAAYIGVGAALGVKFGGQEICGPSAGSLEGQMFWLIMAGAVVGIIIFRWLSLRWPTIVFFQKSGKDK